MTITGNFIGGKTVISSSNETMPVYDPATGKAVREVTVSTAQEVSEAIQVARDAFDSWSRTTPLRRARVLFNFKMLLEQHVEELAGIIVSEHGKVWSDALGELTRGMEVVEFACGIPHLIKGEYSSDVGTGVDSYSLMQPLGVVAGITPFNFPAMVPMWMFPLALACGNSFVLKPPALAPTAAVRLAELLKEAGLPDGVFNVVHCSNEDAEQLYTDPRIAAVSFVGSSGVAEYIYKTASAHGKRVQAFGAAKNHAIVMPDADLDATVNAIMGGAFGSAGERCMALPVVVPVGEATAIALLSPPFDDSRKINAVRRRAMEVAVSIRAMLEPALAGHIARWDDTFSPRSFGDLTTQWGASTVLIEAGGIEGDVQKQRLRKLYFLGLVAALDSIATGSHQGVSPALYRELPENGDVWPDLLVRGGTLAVPGRPPMKADLLINFRNPLMETDGAIADVGDLGGKKARRTINARDLFIVPIPGHAGERTLIEANDDGDNDERPSPLPLTPGASAHFVLSRDPQGRDVVWMLDGSVDPAAPSPPAR